MAKKITKKTLIAAITANEEVVDRDGDNLVDELRVQNFGSFLHCQNTLYTNGHATTLSKNWGIATIFSTSCNCGSRLSSPQPAPENLCDLHNKDMDPLVNVLCDSTRMLTTLSTHCSCAQMSLHNKGHVDNLQELHLERKDSTVGCCLCDTTGMSCTPTMS